MAVYKIRKGLDLPIKGSPVLAIDTSKAVAVKSVAVLPFAYKGLKPRLLVKEGDILQSGDTLFEDKVYNIQFTSPVSGLVKAIERGEKRKILSISIELDGLQKAKSFQKFSSAEINALPRAAVQENLLKTGLWSVIKERPFNKLANPSLSPSSIFVTAMDTRPLALDPAFIINRTNAEAFSLGLTLLSKLTKGYVHVCRAAKADIPHSPNVRVIQHVFEGKHPAGLAGTHIHYIDPVTDVKKKVWHVAWQNVIAIGRLFADGEIFNQRYVSLAGPMVKHPRILQTTAGACLTELLKDELVEGESRVISGSVFGGHKATGALDYLGPFDDSISVIAEDRARHFHGFLAPGFESFSVKPVFASKIFGKKKIFAFGSSQHGSRRDIVPIGSYEQVLPLDMLATPLVRSLLSKDTELAVKLGALELDEDDLALCTFACPGKNDISGALSKLLLKIEAEIG